MAGGRAAVACTRCRVRREKCSGYPCSNCTDNGENCELPNSDATQKKFLIALEERVQALELEQRNLRALVDQNNIHGHDEEARHSSRILRIATQEFPSRETRQAIDLSGLVETGHDTEDDVTPVPTPLGGMQTPAVPSYDGESSLSSRGEASPKISGYSVAPKSRKRKRDSFEETWARKSLQVYLTAKRLEIQVTRNVLIGTRRQLDCVTWESNSIEDSVSGMRELGLHSEVEALKTLIDSCSNCWFKLIDYQKDNLESLDHLIWLYDKAESKLEVVLKSISH